MTRGFDSEAKLELYQKYWHGLQKKVASHLIFSSPFYRSIYSFVFVLALVILFTGFSFPAALSFLFLSFFFSFLLSLVLGPCVLAAYFPLRSSAWAVFLQHVEEKLNVFLRVLFLLNSIMKSSLRLAHFPSLGSGDQINLICLLFRASLCFFSSFLTLAMPVSFCLPIPQHLLCIFPFMLPRPNSPFFSLIDIHGHAYTQRVRVRTSSSRMPFSP